MPGFLRKADTDLMRDEICVAFKELLANRTVVGRPKAKQWLFLSHCFSVLMGDAKSNFPCDDQKAHQYKHEISARLAKHYRTTGPPIRFAFRMVHEDDKWFLEDISNDYPKTNGYFLLVAENDPIPNSPKEARPLVKRVVVEAIDAEWFVYKKLPEIDLSPLDGVFEIGGPAYRRISDNARDRSKKHWTISNPGNHSIKRLLNMTVKKLSGDAAEVHTTEYWDERWWSNDVKDYDWYYHETNDQTYFLVHRNGLWLVRDNIFPPPHTSTPRRKLARTRR